MRDAKTRDLRGNHLLRCEAVRRERLVGEREDQMGARDPTALTRYHGYIGIAESLSNARMWAFRHPLHPSL